MKVTVTEKQVMITEEGWINEGEYGINECEFVLPESFKELCVTAVFNGIPVQLVNSKCLIPSLKNGNCILGVYAYRQDLGETEVIYSPKPSMFFVHKGSFTEIFNEESVPQVWDYDLYCKMLRDYWDDLIKSNTLAGYTEDATENQYYSAKVINEMYLGLQGDLDELGELIGGEETVWSGTFEFAYDEDAERYVAPYENTFPNVENGLYKLSVNGIIFNCMIRTVDGLLTIVSQDGPKIGLVFDATENQVGSLFPIEEKIELEIIKSEYIEDYAVYIAPYDNDRSGVISSLFYKNVFNSEESNTDSFSYKIKDSSGSLIYSSGNESIYYYKEDEAFLCQDRGTEEVYDVIQNSIDSNSPMTFVFTQTLVSGGVITKTIRGVPVIRDDLMNHEGTNYYCWGNIGAFILGS